MKLLVDNNVSFTIAQCLQPIFLEHQIIALRDKFATNTKDIDWIKALDVMLKVVGCSHNGTAT